jgi:hypothetical protein
MTDNYLHIRDEVATWPEISVQPHEFSGSLFALGQTAIGHLHTHGMLDLTLVPEVKAQLVAEGRAAEHHVLPTQDRASYFIDQADGVAQALWLLKVSYLSHLLTQPGQRADGWAQRARRVRAALPALSLSAPLRVIFDRLLSGGS